MGFHGYTKPANYVMCHHTARQGIYEDASLTAGNIRIKLAYEGGPIEDSFNRPDGTNVLPTSWPEVGKFQPGDNPGSFMEWSNFVSLNGIIGGSAYDSTGSATAVNWIGHGSGPGLNRNDADMTVVLTATNKAGLTRADSTGALLYAAVDVVNDLFIVADTNFSTARTILSVPTTINAGQTYTIRMVNAGSSYEVFLDGVSKGTFTDSYYIALPLHLKMGIVAFADSGARFQSVRLAKNNNPAATLWTLRNYLGDVIATGAVTSEFIDIPDSVLTVDGVAGHKYGWYKLYLTGPDHGDGQWGTAYGDCSFLRIANYSGVPANDPGLLSAPNFQESYDEIAAGVMSRGITRYGVDGQSAAINISTLTPMVTRSKTWWIDNGNATRPRRNIVAFPGGTPSSGNAKVTSIVNALKPYVKVWESQNEPDQMSDFVTNHLTPFYATVKAEDPTAIVIAPGLVSFQTPFWKNTLDQFFAAGGDAKCDAYSFHAYNCYNGHLSQMRRNLGGMLDSIAVHGNTSKDIYQTEQGYELAANGFYWPVHAARWAALVAFGQEVMTLGRMRYENNYYWYDTKTGFDEAPMYWIAEGGAGPQVASIRTMAGETRNKTITSELNFGTTGNNMYIGGIWNNPSTGDKVIGVMAASSGANSIRFAVTGAATFTRVDSWGNQTTITASGGFITFPVSELGCWLRVPVGTTATLPSADWTWGPNLCLAGTPHTNSPTVLSTYINLQSMNDGIFNDHHTWGTNAPPYTAGNPFVDFQNTYPTNDKAPLQAWVTFAPHDVDRIVLFCMAPWHDGGTLLDFDLQTFDGVTWTTRQTWTTTDYKSFAWAGVDRCTYESFWQEQYIFDYKAVSPIVNCRGVRVWVRQPSFGGFTDATTSSFNAGNAGYGYWLDINELAAFNTVVPTGDVTPPSKPTGLTATPITQQRIDLAWNASTDNVGVTQYRIYRNGDLMGSAVGTSYVDHDSGFEAFVTYRYTIRALDAIGNPSDESDEAIAVSMGPPPDTTPPTVPTALTATTVSLLEIDLAWSGSTDAVGVAGYKVYRDGVLIGTTPNTFYNDTDLLPADSRFVYTVAAYDAAGNTSAQSVAAVGHTFILINTVAGLTYSDTTVNAGPTYRYVIAAIDAANNQSIFSSPPVAVVGSGVPPAAAASHAHRWRRG